MSRASIATGAFLGALAVGLGAFGAHALREVMDEGAIRLYEKASLYLIIHALALAVTGVVLDRGENRYLRWSALAFVSGVFFFCGSLYLIAFTGIKAFGMTAPVGGVSLIAGWVLLAVGVLKKVN